MSLQGFSAINKYFHLTHIFYFWIFTLKRSREQMWGYLILLMLINGEVIYRDYSSYNEYDSSFSKEDFEVFDDCKGTPSLIIPVY